MPTARAGEGTYVCLEGLDGESVDSGFVLLDVQLWEELLQRATERGSVGRSPVFASERADLELPTNALGRDGILVGAREDAVLCASYWVSGVVLGRQGAREDERWRGGASAGPWLERGGDWWLCWRRVALVAKFPLGRRWGESDGGGSSKPPKSTLSSDHNLDFDLGRSPARFVVQGVQRGDSGDSQRRVSEDKLSLEHFYWEPGEPA